MENPYRKYFSETSLKSWSFENFRCWINHERAMNFQETLFIDLIRKIKDDSTTLKQISDFLTDVSLNFIKLLLVYFIDDYIVLSGFARLPFL